MIKFQGFQTYVAEFSVILVLKSEDRYLRILKHPTKSGENLTRKFSVNFLTSITKKQLKKKKKASQHSSYDGKQTSLEDSASKITELRYMPQVQMSSILRVYSFF